MTSADPIASNLRQVDLRSLISHAAAVQSTATVESVQEIFARRGCEFIAVADHHDLVGVCARRDVSQQLSSRYGFALFAHRPVTSLLLPSPLRVSRSTPITDVFKAVSAREVTEFFDDVVLVDDQKRYLGMIPMRTLVRLQTEFLMRHNAQLETSRAEIVAKNRAMEEDMAMAREVQLALLPAPQPPITAGESTLNIAHRYRAAGEMSGDFFDVLRVSDHAAGILVCDVMGHGVRSSLVTAMVKAMSEQLRSLASDPGVFLSRLNEDLTRILRRTHGLIFVTAAYVLVDIDRGVVRYAQAGHPPPLRWNAATRAWARIACPPEAEGPALGLMDEFAYSTIETPLGVGGRLLLFTDGLVEANNPRGEEFGTERVIAALDDSASRSAEALLDDLLASVVRFSPGPLGDDICLVAIEHVSSESPHRIGHHDARSIAATAR